ncbi:MAG: acyl-CoA carboxylase subunit beta, partial [Solibacillus sp.]
MTQPTYNTQLQQKIDSIYAGGHSKYHEKLKETNKLFVRDRLNFLFDDGKYEEDGRFANCE